MAKALAMAGPVVNGRRCKASLLWVLLYADNIVPHAETSQDQQFGHDAIAAWACRWRFAFRAGPEKNAVMAVIGRVAHQAQPYCATWDGTTSKQVWLACLRAFAAGLGSVSALKSLLWLSCTLTRNDSWAPWAAASLAAAGVLDHCAWGVGLGTPIATGQRWTRRAAVSALSISFQQRFTAASAEIDSLVFKFHSSLRLCCVFPCTTAACRRQTPDAREWGLARCGHHSFCDGRIARHQSYHCQGLLCDCDDGTLEHALNRCPATEDVRSTWRRRVGVGSGYSDGSAAMAWVLDLGSLHNSGPTCAAHVALVSTVSRRGSLSLS
ncbi:unnamed protein product [Polarella glacialis]|uniref:Uncharacterized protein n=1 Tax=Polarella glacialis TaxID=89957 RepID=A0A813DSE2_POLGL|nr:unnamed protein product [Polarella glacialis]